MRPYEYLLKYRQLTVDLVNGQRLYGIDVHEYRNAQDVFDKRNTDNDPDNNVDNMQADYDAGPGWHTAWSALRGRIAKHGRQIGTNRFQLRLPLAAQDKPAPPNQVDEIVNTAELAQAFIGKGTPEIIAQALRLAEALGLVQPIVLAMQKYCDDYIGLDCNGYVGNYLRSEGSPVVGPSTSANASSFLPPAYRLSKLEDVTYRSVLCWKNTGHVAIIDWMQPLQYQAKSIFCMVCESTGARLIPGDIHTDGLNYTQYEIHEPDKHKVFKVKRGLGGSRLNEVYIGDLI